MEIAVTSQIVALLASAGLVTAGVAATAETRSASALPTVPAGQVLSMGQPIDCSLDQNKNRSECADQAGGAERGAGGGMIGALVGTVGAVGLIVALKNDSNG